MDSPVFIILLALILTLISLSSSKILLLPLTHSLAKSQFNSTHHLLKSTTTRSATRFHHHKNRQVSLPLSPGTDYTLSFSLGSTTSLQTISLYMDTGSDVVWLPCSPFTCILCEGKYSPSTIPNHKPLNLTNSTPLTCQSRGCSAVHSHLPTSDLCAMARCPLESIEMSECSKFPCPPFYYAYGDGSLVARLYSDNLVVPMSSPALMIKNFTFGCAHSALGEPIGVAGFGRGTLSLPAQLASFSPQLGNQFSYCLVSHSFDTDRVRRPSPLILGRYSVENKEKQIGYSQNDDFVYTPMLENPKHPYFYYVGLEGVSVGKRQLTAPPSLKRIDRSGNGGMVVDSGTTFTMLPAELYELVVTEFDQRVGGVYKRASDTEGRTGLSPCYFIDDSVGNKTRVVVPQVALHFGGNSTVVMPRRNYFHEFLDDGGDGKKKKKKVGCMMLMNGGAFPDSGGPAGLLGNYQQQGLEVVYDLENNRVGFARRKCASLWDNFN